MKTFPHPAARIKTVVRAVAVTGFAVFAALLIVLGVLHASVTHADEQPRLLPAPALDEPAGRTRPEVAVLAGGCFWGVQGVYQHVQGVLDAVSGYTGGSEANAHYELVSEGNTGHAESVQITYDPRRISYGALLQIFFSAVHDPTELNRQGPDEGSQYRSAVFPQNPEQARIAAAYIAQLSAAHAFASPIVTRVEPGHTFYPAEAYHQNYLASHTSFPYIVINDLPKIVALRRLFPQRYQRSAVLVAQVNPSH
jgi:peptide-methionine (S)-S-oxide reductase